MSKYKLELSSLAALFIGLAGLTPWCLGRSEHTGNKVDLPLILYDECGCERPFDPSGWMGDTEAIVFDECCREAPHRGETCLKLQYVASGQWCGMAWQHPQDNWGDMPGGYDLRAAKKIVFWARGEQGGEEVEFKYGILGEGKEYRDSTMGEGKVIKLTPDWKEYRIYVKGDRRCIITGFCWVIESGPEDVTFYLDDVRYE
ncbi:MAG: hypothetical protein JXB04_13205 [Kiritimatiellae bacterium]|nr:hypothetical protein [Kiritimatiellia bacterium]